VRTLHYSHCRSHHHLAALCTQTCSVTHTHAHTSDVCVCVCGAELHHPSPHPLTSPQPSVLFSSRPAGHGHSGRPPGSLPSPSLWQRRGHARHGHPSALQQQRRQPLPPARQPTLSGRKPLLRGGNRQRYQRRRRSRRRMIVSRVRSSQKQREFLCLFSSCWAS